MGKKGKKTRRNNKNDKLESVLDGMVFKDVLAYEFDLVAYAEKDLSTRASRCFGKLALAHAESSDKGHYPWGYNKKVEHYLDRIMAIYDNERIVMNAETAYLLFSIYARNFSKKEREKCMKIYYARGLKGRLSIEEVSDLCKRSCFTPSIPDTREVLEDHLAVAEEAIEMAEARTFYNHLFSVYKCSNQRRKLHESLTRALDISMKSENTELQLFVMSEMSSHYSMIGKYGKAHEMLKTCLEINGSSFSVFSELGTLIERKSVAVNKVMLRRDAEAALEMHMRACNLLSDVICEEIGANQLEMYKKIISYHHRIGTLYSIIGEYNRGIKSIADSMKIASESKLEATITDPVDNDSVLIYSSYMYRLLSARNYLREFYNLKSLGQAFDESELLGKAKSFIEDARKESLIYLGSDMLIVSAQVYYFLHEIDEAYVLLARFLDDYIKDECSRKCAGCHQIFGFSAYGVKRCSVCMLISYCSPRCQKLHWKTDIAGEIRHKTLCPLLAYWRMKWSWKYRASCQNYESGTNIEDPHEHLTETCRRQFKQFFENVLETEKEKVTLSQHLNFMDVD